MGSINVPDPSKWFTPPSKPVDKLTNYADPSNSKGLGRTANDLGKSIGLPQNDPALDAVKAKDAADRLLAEAAARRANEEGAANAKNQGVLAKSRQKAIAGAAQGRRATILTGPLGLGTAPDTTRKSILGA